MTVGRKPTPTYLRVVRGNPGKRALPKHEPMPQGDLAGPPAYFTAAQRKVWETAIKNAPPSMLKLLDWSVLAAWTVACCLHAEACERLAAEGIIVPSTVQGVAQQHPALAIINRQALIMLRASSDLGFSPTSRAKVQVVKPRGGTSALDEFAS